MESKIMIDINYASRSPQIVIRYKDSDDPRDKLVSMLTGEAMPGVRDGYCRIERYPGPNEEIAVITPIHPVEAIKHIPTIALLAESNGSIDTTQVSVEYRRIIESECKRIRLKDYEKSEIAVDAEVPDPIVDLELTYAAALEMVNDASSEKLPADLHKKWHEAMLDPHYDKLDFNGPSEVGELLPGEHFDELKPRAATWLGERRNWQKQVHLLETHIKQLEENSGNGVKGDDWLQANLPPNLYKKWVDEVLYRKKSSQG